MSGHHHYSSIDHHKVSGSVPAIPDPPPITVNFTGSNFQPFPSSGAQGKITSASRPPRDADGISHDLISFLEVVISYISYKEECVGNIVLEHTFSKPASGSDEPQQQQSGWFQAFTIAAYKPYFDVDTCDVLERIKDSLFPFRGTFNEKTATNPDLYGPFWICTTLIFVAASIGTFVTFISHKVKDQEWNYDINLVTWSAGLFYGYVTIVPLGLYVILKYFSVPSGLVQLFCLYGYSLFIFIPAMCMSIVPLEIFRWVIAGVAGFMSATFVALNLRAHIMSAGESWFLIVASIFLLQLALSVALKIYLFTVSV
ncbi:unnamed protein product [Lupinus luteus]|uniref:Protein YIP n=1 Tax=Lupinus luteus TaxID=3873 RepID=A0AAV1VT84_LUPLU